MSGRQSTIDYLRHASQAVGLSELSAMPLCRMTSAVARNLHLDTTTAGLLVTSRQGHAAWGLLASPTYAREGIGVTLTLLEKPETTRAPTRLRHACSDPCCTVSTWTFRAMSIGFAANHRPSRQAA